MPDVHVELSCVVVTPERALMDEKADFIALPMYDGELGVLPGRAALIGRLGCGELRVRRGEQTQYFFVDGGFVQVRENTVTVLTSSAQRATEINAATAQSALQQQAAGVSADERAKAQDRARAQLRVARHREGSAAHG
jgi:F-type H+-transporting ATPase subunit epsilon